VESGESSPKGRGGHGREDGAREDFLEGIQKSRKKVKPKWLLGKSEGKVLGLKTRGQVSMRSRAEASREE